MRGEIRYQDLSAVLISGESRIDATTLEFDQRTSTFRESCLGISGWSSQEALLLRARGDSAREYLRVNEDDPILEAEDGRFVSNLSWRGSPLGFSLLESQGTVELSLKKGRFLDLGNSAEVLRLWYFKYRYNYETTAIGFLGSCSTLCCI